MEFVDVDTNQISNKWLLMFSHFCAPLALGHHGAQKQKCLINTSCIAEAPLSGETTVVMQAFLCTSIQLPMGTAQMICNNGNYTSFLA